MRFFWTISLVAMACTPELGKTDEHELTRASSPPSWLSHSKALSGGHDKREALQALEILMDSQHPLTIGRVCYYGGTPPLGRQAVDGLVEMERADLLGRALRAPSPEGRLYAAIGLARLGKFTWDEVAARASREADVEVCSGCLVGQVSASRGIEYYEAGASAVEE